MQLSRSMRRSAAVCLVASLVSGAQVAVAQPLTSNWAQVDAELESHEQDALGRLLSPLPSVQRTALLDLVMQQPVGERGLLISKVLQATPEQQAGLIAYLHDQTAEGRQQLASQLGDPDSEEWAAFLFSVAGYPAGPVVFKVRSVQVTNGQPAAPFSSPWQAQIFKSGASAAPMSLLELSRERRRYRRFLMDYERLHECGAVLLSAKWALTAAHCIRKPRSGHFLDTRRVRTGTQNIRDGGTSWRIAAVVKHAGYNAFKQNDIALLKLAADSETKSAANKHARPIGLPDISDPPLRAGDTVFVNGWGVTEETPIGSKFLDSRGQAKRPSPMLMEAKLRNVGLERCNTNANLLEVGAKVSAGQICAAGVQNRDACQGDSGGPLVRRNAAGKARLVGLVSYGAGCGLDDTPGVYVDVRYYLKWIKEAAKRAQDGRMIEWSEAAPR